MVVNNLDILDLMIQVLFGHVNVQYHLYHFYKDDLLIDKMMVTHYQELLTMLIDQVIDIEVHKQELMHVEHRMIQILINNFLRQLKSNQTKNSRNLKKNKSLLQKDLWKVNI
jgi:hypothetical protein